MDGLLCNVLTCLHGGRHIKAQTRAQTRKKTDCPPKSAGQGIGTIIRHGLTAVLQNGNALKRESKRQPVLTPGSAKKRLVEKLVIHVSIPVRWKKTPFSKNRGGAWPSPLTPKFNVDHVPFASKPAVGVVKRGWPWEGKKHPFL